MGAFAGAAAASAFAGSCNAVGGFEELVGAEAAGAGVASQLDVTTFFVGDFFAVLLGRGFAVEGFAAVSGLGDSGGVDVGAGV